MWVSCVRQVQHFLERFPHMRDFQRPTPSKWKEGFETMQGTFPQVQQNSALSNLERVMLQQSPLRLNRQDERICTLSGII